MATASLAHGPSSDNIYGHIPFFLDGPGVGPELSGFGVLPPDPSFSEFLDFFL